MEIRYKVMTNSFDFRLEMVRSAQQYGVSETARLFEVSKPRPGWLEYHRGPAPGRAK